MKITGVAGFAPITTDPRASRRFYKETLGLQFEQDQGEYLATDALPGLGHFGLWPLSDAARSCFGVESWPADVPVPQGCLEYEMESPEAVNEGAAELEARGYRLLRRPESEPWQQITARLLSPEGLLIGLCWTPWKH